MREKVREGSTKGKGGLYKMPQISTLPSKWPRSGVTFHFCEKPTTESDFSWADPVASFSPSQTTHCTVSI